MCGGEKWVTIVHKMQPVGTKSDIRGKDLLVKDEVKIKTSLVEENGHWHAVICSVWSTFLFLLLTLIGLSIHAQTTREAVHRATVSATSLGVCFGGHNPFSFLWSLV